MTVWQFRRKVAERKHYLDAYCCPLGVGSEPFYRGSPWPRASRPVCGGSVSLDYAEGLAQGYDLATEGKNYGRFPRDSDAVTGDYALGLRYGRRIGALVKAQRNIHG